MDVQLWHSFLKQLPKQPTDTITMLLDGKHDEDIKDAMKTYFKNNMEFITTTLLTENNPYRTAIIIKHIKRFETVLSISLFGQTDLYGNLLLVYNTLNGKEMTDNRKQISDRIVDYINTRDPVALQKIYRLAIEHHQINVVDRLRYNVDISEFMKQTDGKMDINQVMHMRPNKLCEYLNGK